MCGYKLALYTVAIVILTAILTAAGVVGVVMNRCYAIMGIM